MIDICRPATKAGPQFKALLKKLGAHGKFLGYLGLLTEAWAVILAYSYGAHGLYTRNYLKDSFRWVVYQWAV